MTLRERTSVNPKKACTVLFLSLCILFSLLPVDAFAGSFTDTAFQGVYTTANIDAIISKYELNNNWYWTTQAGVTQTYHANSNKPGWTWSTENKGRKDWVSGWYGCRWDWDVVDANKPNKAGTGECYGFAEFIGYLLSGKRSPQGGDWKKYTSLSDAGGLRVGDIIRIENGNYVHSAVVYSVNGDNVTFIQAGGSNYNKLNMKTGYWGANMNGSTSAKKICSSPGLKIFRSPGNSGGIVSDKLDISVNNAVPSSGLPKKAGEGIPSGKLNPGSGFGLRGTITSPESITSVVASITDRTTGKLVAGLSHGNPITIQPNSTQVDIRYTDINNNLIFSEIPVGYYSYEVVVTTASGRQETMISSEFQVGDPAPLTIPVQSITITRNDGSEDDLGAFQVYKAVISPDNATNKNVAWTIGNEYIVENKDQGIDDAGAPFIILKNMHIDDTTLRATAQDGSGVSAEIPVTVSTNITGAEYYAGYYRGEDLDPDNMQLKTGDVFHVGVNWWWSYEPDTYDYQFVLEDTSGLEAYEDDSRHSGCFIAKKPGTWKVYLDFFENGQLIRDVDYTYVVHVSCAHASTEWQETKAPTCTEVGVKQLICDACGELLETQIIAMLEHVPGEWATVREATITEKGLKERRCARCGILLESEEIPVTACTHPSSTWVIVREATVDQDGLKERRCDACSAVLESEAIPKPEQPAAYSAQLKAAATTFAEDGTFTVTLSLANNPGIGFIVIQNSAAQGISLQKAEGIGAAATASVTYGTNATLSSTAPITGENGILLLTFKSETREEATLQFSCGQCFTTDEEPVTVSGTSVKVTVSNRIPGDATDDGIVDGRDVLRLMKYFAGQAVTFNEANADVTGDGIVDGRDVLRLMKYFAGLNVTLQ